MFGFEKVVGSNNEFAFLPSISKRKYLVLESIIYSEARRSIEDYNGGCWDFMELKTDDKTLRIMVPTEKDKYHLTCWGMQKDVEISAFGVGLALMIMGLSQLCGLVGEDECERLINLIDGLKDFVSYSDFNEKSQVWDYLD